MRSIQSSAKTMEEAVTQGLEKLGVSLGDVTIDILDEGSKGFLGLLGSKPVMVKLTVREGVEDGDILSAFSLEEAVPKDETAPRAGRGKTETAKGKGKEKVAKAAAPSKDDRPARGERPSRGERASRAERPADDASSAPVTPAPLCDPVSPEGRAQQFLLKVTHLMGVSVSVAASRDAEGNVRVDMHGDTLGILIGRRGETLDALQYLTSLNVNKGQDDYIRVTLDTENYRAKREEALTRLANRMANRAVKTGRKVVMEPMNPYERRILHSALQQNDAVTTHSEGDEPNRHVVITLKQE